MSKQNFDTILDFGSSKIRFAVFDNTLPKKNIISEEDCLTGLNIKNINFDKSEQLIEKLIKTSEKKFNTHLNNINIMIDTPDLFSIDVSIKNNFEGKKIDEEDIKYLLQEIKILIQNNYSGKKILHIILEKIIIDNKDYNFIPKEKISCKKLILEIKFICFSDLIYNKLIEHLKKNHISINQIYCSSYVKSFNYNELFENYDKKIFLDIGYKKSCLTIYNKKRLILIKTVPLGGNHITRDISQVLKITEEEAENLKKTLYQSNVTFSDTNDDDLKMDDELKNKLNDRISLDLLKQVIFARIEEIISLSFKDANLPKLIEHKKNSILIFTGEGSKILNKNSIYLPEEFNFFEDINFFDETPVSICQAGYRFNKTENLYEVNIIPKKLKKSGFFERLFHFFN
tara:strand:- start:396 stop:1595 length:1200 start_codon:yes stop_codon:yes gene_type:complete